MDKRGFTLPELIIAMGIGLVIAMAAVAIFSTSNWSYKVQEDVVEAQQNVRVAMDRLVRDLRMAGFGLPDPPFMLSIGGQNLTAPVTATNSTTGPDTVTILGIGYETGMLFRGTNTDCNGIGQSLLCLDSLANVNNFFGAGPSFLYNNNRRYISLNGMTFIELANNQPGRTSWKLALGNPGTLDRNYPDGTRVYIIQAVRYYIETGAPSDSPPCTATNPCLRSQDFTGLRGNGALTLAENIEDMQFAYGIDANPKDGKIDDKNANGAYDDKDFRFSETTTNDAVPDPSTIIIARVSLTAKARNEDPKGQTGFIRPAIEEHTAGTGDKYRRRVLTNVVKVRNPKTGW